MPLVELMITPIVIGLGHSVETDHVIAVGNLVTVRSRLLEEAVRGASWGLGHTVSVMISAFMFNYLKDYIIFSDTITFELLVGIMMVIIGIFRLISLYVKPGNKVNEDKKLLFFNVGIVHGLAGSGTIAAMLSTQISEIPQQFLFLSLFGLGTILGMGTIAAFLTRLKFLHSKYLSMFSLLIAGFSLLYGIKIITDQIL